MEMQKNEVVETMNHRNGGKRRCLIRTEFMNHVERQWQLVNEDGKLNTDAIKRLFDDVEKDDDSSVTNFEMEKLVQEIIGNGQLKVDDKLFDKFNEKHIVYILLALDGWW